MGTLGVTVAVEAGAGGGAAGMGNAAGWAGGGASCRGLAGVCGASTPEELPGGIRFWLGPIEPGGRGIESNPGGAPCPSACEATTCAQAKASATMK